MATVSLSAFSAALSLIFMSRTTEQFRTDVVLPNLLAVKQGRNATCVWNAKFSGRSAGGAYSEGADMADADYDAHTRAKASLNWAQYRKGAKVSGLAQAVAAASNGSGAGDLNDILLEEVIDATHDLTVEVSSDLYGGDPSASPTELAGAAIAIDGTAGTFAGLASATYSDWLASEQTLATSQLSQEKLRTLLHRPVKDATGRDPDFVTCPGALFDKVRGLADENKDTTVMVRGANGMVDIYAAMGVRAVTIDGVPYIEDRHCTANTFYAWSARDVEIRQIPAANSRVSPNEVRQAFLALTGTEVPLSDIEAGLRQLHGEGGRLVPYVQLLASTGDAMKVMVKVYLQLAWKRRNSFAKLTLI